MRSLKESFETKTILSSSFLFSDMIALLLILTLKTSFPEKKTDRFANTTRCGIVSVTGY